MIKQTLQMKHSSFEHTYFSHHSTSRVCTITVYIGLLAQVNPVYNDRHLC